MSRKAKAMLWSDSSQRWKAEIVCNDGRKLTVFLEEMDELQEIVELGPDWNTIDRIVVTLN